MRNAKRWLVLLITVCFILTCCTLAAQAAAEDDFFRYLAENNVDPDTYIGILSSLTASDSLQGERYAVRDISEIEYMRAEVCEMAVQYATLDEQTVENCIYLLHNAFGENTEGYSAMIVFFMNPERIVLPIGEMTWVDENCPSVQAFVQSKMFSMTYFMNALQGLNIIYMSHTGQPILTITGNDLSLRANAELVCAYSTDFLGTENAQVMRTILDEIQDILNSLPMEVSGEEQYAFIEYMANAGILPESYTEDAVQVDEVMREAYNQMAPTLAGGDSVVGAYASPSALAERYRGGDISAALSAAATVTVKSTNARLSQDEYLYFATLNARETRNALIETGTPVPENTKYTYTIKLPENANTADIHLPTSFFTLARTEAIERFVLRLPKVTLVIDGAEAALSEAPISGITEIMVRNAAASQILPQLAFSGTGTELRFYKGTNEVTDIIPGSLMRVYPDAEEGQTYTSNSYYTYREGKALMSDYAYEEEGASFALEADRAYVYHETTKNTDDNSEKTNNEGNTENNENTDKTDKTGNTEENKENKTENTTDADKNTGNTGKTDVNGNTNGSSGTENTGYTNGGNDTEGGENGGETAKPSVPKAETGFSDVAETHWAQSFIYALADKKVLEGVGGGLYMPEAPVTREQFAKILVAAFSLTSTGEDTGFTDVANDAWYAPYVAAAYQNGIIQGRGDGTFGVGQNITRQDMAVMLARVANKLEISMPYRGEMPTFADANAISTYASAAVTQLCRAGLISGFAEDNTIRPTAGTTRAQAAKLVYLVMAMR